MATGIDVSTVDAALQRSPHTPPGTLRGSLRVRRRFAAAGAQGAHGAIAWQPVSPVLESTGQSLAEYRAGDTAAIDEQIRGKARAIVQLQRVDKAVRAS